MSPDWNRIVKCGKYKAIYFPSHPRAWSTGYIHLHIVVAEIKLGRLLLPQETVHHKNLNKLDNDPSNIQICQTPSEHGKIHKKPTTMVSLKCHQCGGNFKRRKGNDPEAKRYKNPFCNRECYYASLRTISS